MCCCFYGFVNNFDVVLIDTMLPSMFAFGIRPLLPILPRSEPKANTTTLQYLTQQRSLPG